QLVFLKTPPHAAVDTSVALAGELRNQKFKGLVNSLLRKLVNTESPTRTDETARLNTPDWLWKSWCAAYGEENASQISTLHLEEPPLDLSVKSEPDRWAEELGGEILPSGSLRKKTGGNPAEWPGFEEGAWWVQDAAAALPVKLLGDFSGLTAIDLCAAPGGKTAQLANGGAKVTAVDISEKRLARLRSNMARLGLAVETVAADLRDWRPQIKADLVVLDAPCTATGTCRRHPDILRLREAVDVAKLAAVQRSLLAAAQEMVGESGTLLYITCSLQPEEGPDQIADFLNSYSGFEQRPFGNLSKLGLEGSANSNGSLRTLPSHFSEFGGMDGFFAVALERVS
ncbi:MAG TPA: MFS transporter, partial [Rhodospirillaceae bacterium]|nr:MFS transporter [Rhodospirillaceae bacterium]